MEEVHGLWTLNHNGVIKILFILISREGHQMTVKWKQWSKLRTNEKHKMIAWVSAHNLCYDIQIIISAANNVF